VNPASHSFARQRPAATDRITVRLRPFVEEYLACPDATPIAIRSGCSAATARQVGTETLYGLSSSERFRMASQPTQRAHHQSRPACRNRTIASCRLVTERRRRERNLRKPHIAERHDGCGGNGRWRVRSARSS
jgi:hypothetical protein